MKVNGLKVDAQAIANGLYGIIQDKGEEAIVAFGMIPKWVIDMTEKMLREKIISEAAKQACCSPEELKPIVDQSIVDGMVREIMHEITLGIYQAAKDHNALLV